MRPTALALIGALSALACRRPQRPSATTVGRFVDAGAQPAATDAAVDVATAAPRCSALTPHLAASARADAGVAVEVSEDRSPAVVSACAALVRPTRALLTRALRHTGGATEAPSGGDPPEPLGPVGRCLPAGRGAWLLELTALTTTRTRCYMDRSRQCPRTEGRWGLVYVTPEGTALRAPAFTGEVFLSDPSESHLEVPLRFDYDGDGVAELWVRVRATNFEGGNGLDAAFVVTVRDGALAPYAPARGLEGATLEDLDGDGRPDLRLDSPYQASNACESDGVQTHQGPRLAAHALPDGTFSRDDAVVRESVLVQCERVPLQGAFADRSADLVLAVGCERFRGRTAAQVERALREAGGDAPSFCPGLDPLVETAQRDPPFTVARCETR